MDQLTKSRDPGEPPVRFDVGEQADGTVVVTIAGELDMSAVDALHKRVAPKLERQPSRLVVDVSELRFADSSAIALWVRWASAARAFELRRPSPLLLRVIEGMGLRAKLGAKP